MLVSLFSGLTRVVLGVALVFGFAYVGLILAGPLGALLGAGLVLVLSAMSSTRGPTAREIAGAMKGEDKPLHSDARILSAVAVVVVAALGAARYTDLPKRFGFDFTSTAGVASASSK
jgi:hypothetical protein